MTDLITLLLSPRGRIGRRTYLVAVGCLIVANLMVGLIPTFGTIAVLLLIWPFSCIVTKRLHDGGRSGLPVAIVAAASLSTGIFAGATTTTAIVSPVSAVAFAAAAALLGTITFVATVLLLIWAALIPGEAGDNRFGAPDAADASLLQILRGDHA